VVPETSTLPRNQAARRSRVIEAAVALAAEGGYDAVQMRDVAVRASVALGTIYRYFTSKDQLLAAAMVEWLKGLEDEVGRRPPRGDTAAERVVDVVRRASRTLGRNPNLTAALVTAVSAPDPDVVPLHRESSAAMQRILSASMGDLDDATKADVVRVLNHVWFSALLAWVHGWTDVDHVIEELEVAGRLVLREVGPT
jgi:TetR/AcrR family transcriptional regulator, cholesterol catabolism regulator